MLKGSAEKIKLHISHTKYAKTLQVKFKAFRNPLIVITGSTRNRGTSDAAIMQKVYNGFYLPKVKQTLSKLQ